MSNRVILYTKYKPFHEQFKSVVEIALSCVIDEIFNIKVWQDILQQFGTESKTTDIVT
jgi:hypothetical protein